MKRIFIAINLDRESVANLNRELSPIKQELNTKNVKWTKPENIHFTLAFLGDIAENKLQVISNKLQVVTKGFKSFDIKLKGLGIFPNLTQPRILWIAVKSPELKRLAEAVQKELRSVSFKIDEKPFKSHLTIGRIRFVEQKFKEKLPAIIDQYEEKQFGQFQAKTIEIMESKLQPDGPKYSVVESIKLGE